MLTFNFIERPAGDCSCAKTRDPGWCVIRDGVEVLRPDGKPFSTDTEAIQYAMQTRTRDEQRIWVAPVGSFVYHDFGQLDLGVPLEADPAWLDSEFSGGCAGALRRVWRFIVRLATERDGCQCGARAASECTC